MKSVKTSASASAKDVSFVDVPSHAVDVRYWDDGNNRIVVFSIDEMAFIKMFPSISFEQIAVPKHYYLTRFGDVNKPPYKMEADAIARSGIFFDSASSNGGGASLLYDREKKIAFIYFVQW